MVARDNVVATQFHAEKSGPLGLVVAARLRRVGSRMLTKRLIVCFDVVNGRVTKAQQFQDNIDVAPAEELAQQLYADQIDEIVFYDIKASAEKRKIDLDTVQRVAHHVFVPFTVGGGIREVDDMYEVLKAGAEKISVDSMAVRNPEIIRDGAGAFGRQCVVLSTQVNTSASATASRAATRCSSTEPASPPVSTPSTGCGAAKTSARARSSSTASTGTAPRRATTSTSPGRSPTR